MKDKTIILKVRTGSHCHGTNLPESDTDIRGICIPDIHHFFGLKRFEQFEKNDKEKKQDMVFYSIEKYLQLACKGNLSALNFLFSHKKDLFYVDEFGQRILDFRQNFVTKRLINSIFGYCKSQLHKMHVGHGDCGNRIKLVQKYGYDTKFAYHALMITYIGIQVLKTGTYSALLPDGQRKQIMRIRLGKMQYNECMSMIKGNLEVMSTLEPLSKLPKEPDEAKVSDLMVNILKDYFHYTDAEEFYGRTETLPGDQRTETGN